MVVATGSVSFAHVVDYCALTVGSSGQMRTRCESRRCAKRERLDSRTTAAFNSLWKLSAANGVLLHGSFGSFLLHDVLQLHDWPLKLLVD